METQRSELNNFTRIIYIKGKSGTWKNESETYTYYSGLEVGYTREKVERKALKFNKPETKDKQITTNPLNPKTHFNLTCWDREGEGSLSQQCLPCSSLGGHALRLLSSQ